MTPVMWLMAGNMAIWIGFGAYAYYIWRVQQHLEVRFVRLESSIKEFDNE